MEIKDWVIIILIAFLVWQAYQEEKANDFRDNLIDRGMALKDQYIGSTNDKVCADNVTYPSSNEVPEGISWVEGECI